MTDNARTALERYGLEVRPPHRDDIPYLTSTWLRSYREAPAMAAIGSDIYYTNQHRIIEELWEPATWMVATLRPFPSFIAGWLCGEATDRGPIIHYVYVRHNFDGQDGKVKARRAGIATALVHTFLDGMPGNRVWYTHDTHLSRKALRGKMAEKPGMAGWEYNPWLAWRRVGG